MTCSHLLYVIIVRHHCHHYDNNNNNDDDYYNYYIMTIQSNVVEDHYSFSLLGDIEGTQNTQVTSVI